MKEAEGKEGLCPSAPPGGPGGSRGPGDPADSAVRSVPGSCASLRGAPCGMVGSTLLIAGDF